MRSMRCERDHAAVPDLVIQRLPLYLRELRLLKREGVSTIASVALAARLHSNPNQVRKDLNYFGSFGIPGLGYPVTSLMTALREILGLDRVWNTAVVGAGRLGQALVSHFELTATQFRVVAVFDTDPSVVGKRVQGLVVEPIAELASTIIARRIVMAIVALPPSETQSSIDLLAESGIRTILNYAPVSISVPPNVAVRTFDPVTALESLTYYLTLNGYQKTGSATGGVYARRSGEGGMSARDNGH